MQKLPQQLLSLLGMLFTAALFFILAVLLTQPTSTQSYDSLTPEITEPTYITPPPKIYTYVQITKGCAISLTGSCAWARSGPGAAYSATKKLRTGIILKIDYSQYSGGELWHRVVFDEWIRYPERVKGRWHVRDADVAVFTSLGAQELTERTRLSTSSKYIIVDRSSQKLYAYDGDTLVLSQSVSTGLFDSPTPRGSFKIFRKTPSRYMQGPLPGISPQYYDLPGVPWSMYFTKQGGAIHGAYWHNRFGSAWSHGCVNLPVNIAEQLYYWAELGTPVYVRD